MAWTYIQTDVGRELIASAFGKELNYTRIKIGSGSVPIEQLAMQTDVADYVKDISIVDYKNEGATSSVFGRVDNSDITQPTPFVQMGVFANVDDGEEVLLSIYQDDTPWTIPTPDKQSWDYEPQFNLIVSNAEDFSSDIDWNAYAKLRDLPKIELPDDAISTKLSYKLISRGKNWGSWYSEPIAEPMSASLLTDDGKTLNGGLTLDDGTTANLAVIPDSSGI